MHPLQTRSGFASINNARIYYETAGTGTPFIMIHAGVADNRQWNNEFAHFAQTHQVLRYDMRGYGQSEPVEGEFSHMGDLSALLESLEIHAPAILMGCSMGGTLAMDLAIAQPQRVQALIMVGSTPSGLNLDVETPAKFEEAEKAYEAGDLDLLAELEIQIWFDGTGRTPEQVNPAMRKLAYEMNRIALRHDARKLGKRLPNLPSPAIEHLQELKIPVLVIVGSHDTPFILAAADYMTANLNSAHKATISDAAHLPNMDQPEKFRAIITDFLSRTSL